MTYMPLHVSILGYRNRDIVQLFFAYDADVAHKDASGLAPLQTAIELYKSADELIQLIELGPDVIEGLRSTLNTLALAMNTRCGKNSSVSYTGH